MNVTADSGIATAHWRNAPDIGHVRPE